MNLSAYSDIEYNQKTNSQKIKDSFYNLSTKIIRNKKKSVKKPEFLQYNFNLFYIEKGKEIENNHYNYSFDQTEKYLLNTVRIENSIKTYKNIIEKNSQKVSSLGEIQYFRRFKNFCNSFNKKYSNTDSKDTFFYCENFRIFGLSNSSNFIDHSSIINSLQIRGHKLCNKKQLLRDVLILKKMKYFSKMNIFLIKKNAENTFDVMMHLTKLNCQKISNLAFINCKLFPNSQKSAMINYFVGRDADLSNLSLIKKIIDTWYDKWDYLSCGVKSIYGAGDGNIRVKIKETFINSLNIFFLNEYDVLTEGYRKLGNFHNKVLQPVTSIFQSIIPIRIGQPYTRDLNINLINYMINLGIVEGYNFYEHMPQDELLQDYPYMNKPPTFLDVYFFISLASFNSLRFELQLSFPIKMLDLDETLTAGMLVEAEWDLITIKRKIQVFSIYYEKEASVYRGYFDEIDLLCELYLPYFNYTNDSENLISLNIMLFNEDGMLFLNDTGDNFNAYGEYQNLLDADYYRRFEKYTDSINYYNAGEEWTYQDEMNVLNQDFSSEWSNRSNDMDVYYEYTDEPFDSYRLGIKVALEEHISNNSSVELAYIFNYILIEDSYELQLQEIENYFNQIEVIRDSYPFYANNQNIDPKISFKISFVTNNVEFLNEFWNGYKTLYSFESGISLDGIYQRLALDFTNYCSRITKKNILKGICCATNLKLGYHKGYLPFYEGFLLGGFNSIRGYYDGELGLSRNMFQASLELRYLLNCYIDRVYNFFDFCTDLGSSSSILYNPNDYKLLPGYGSSFGVGMYIGSGRIEYGLKTSISKPFINFEYGERY